MLCYYIILIYIDIYIYISSEEFWTVHMQFLFRATHAIPLSPRKGNRLGAFLGLLVPDNSASLLSEQRQADTDLFHIKPVVWNHLLQPAPSIKSCLRTHLFKSRMKSMLFFVLFFNVVHKIVAACGPVSCIWFWTVWTSSERVMWSRCGCGLPKDVFDGVTASVIMLSGG